MTYEKIFSEVKKNFKKAKISDTVKDFAFQFNITGDGEGIFYAACKNGVLSVEPYDYKDRDVIFEGDGKTLIAIASGKMEPIDAIKSGKLAMDGNHELAKQLIFLMNTAKKSDEKKTAAKTTAKKEAASAAKATAVKETKTAAKTAAKPTAAKAQPKTAAKTAAEPAVKAPAKAKPAAKKAKKQ